MISYDDLEVGSILTAGTYEVTKEEIIQFARKWDPRPQHIDQDEAVNSHFGSLIACSAHLFAIYSLLAFEAGQKYGYGENVIAGLGQDQKIVNPARPGDILTLRNELLEKRASESNPDQGIVRSREILSNQRAEPILTVVAASLWSRSPR